MGQGLVDFFTAPDGKTLKDFVKIAQENSPYLSRLCAEFPDVIDGLERQSPQTLLDNILSETGAGAYDDVCRELRIAKKKTHLLLALCDITGVWDWQEITAALSRFGDHCMEILFESVAAYMGFAKDDSGDRGPAAGVFVLALGKYGGRELNYSSDIDLIVFYDPQFIALPSDKPPEQTLIRFVKKLMRGFDAMTEDGYIFRTDLRLRPDPRANSVAVSTLTAERYYEMLGQNWERAAMIKARFCGGDMLAAGEFIKNVLTPFIWRRNLDYAAISDIHAIKRQIQGAAAIDDIALPGHDLKLGLGGIREIEFFVQVQQLILGGRHKSLRTPRTVDVLPRLAQGGYIEEKTAIQLAQDYGDLRGLEHRVQMYDDAQTHIWPKDKAKREQISMLAGAGDLAAFEDKQTQTLRRVHACYVNLFPGEEELASEKGSLVFTGVAPEALTLETLRRTGFARGVDVWHQMAGWLGGRIRATRTERAREILTRLAPRIIEACGASGVPDAAFFSFAEFITKLNAGVSLFSLLQNKNQALVSLINILVLAPPLTVTLSAHPGLIDAMAEPDFLARQDKIPPPDYQRFIPQDTDFETALNQVRKLVHEDQLALVAGILKRQHLDKAGARFSDIASGAIAALLPVAANNVAGKNEGEVNPLTGDYAVLALGKLGAREMNYKSDIDLMLVYNEDGGGGVRMFNKLTRRLITALSSVTQEGGLYEVDMALRPSGRSGPLAVSYDAFLNYYRRQAWTWEFMALSRARVVAGSSVDFCNKLDRDINVLLGEKKYGGSLNTDIADMYDRLAREKPAQGQWDVKFAKGGIRDIEFIAQYLILRHKPKLRIASSLGCLELAQRQNWLAVQDCETLIGALRLYQDFLQITAVAVDGVFVPQQASNSLTDLLAAVSGQQNFKDYSADFFATQNQVHEIFERTVMASPPTGSNLGRQ